MNASQHYQGGLLRKRSRGLSIDMLRGFLMASGRLTDSGMLGLELHGSFSAAVMTGIETCPA